VKPDRAIAMAGSIVLHLLALAGAAALHNARPTLLPEFSAGESSLALTLVPPAPEPPPVPEQPEPPPPEPLPEFPDAVELPEPPPPEDEWVEEPETPEPPPELQPQVEPEPAPEPDADLQTKGVETPAIDVGGVRPRYPLGSRLRSEEGVVRLRVEVDNRGRAALVELVESSGFTALDREAQRAASRARYRDANGETRAGTTTFNVRFRLTD